MHALCVNRRLRAALLAAFFLVFSFVCFSLYGRKFEGISLSKFPHELPGSYSSSGDGEVPESGSIATSTSSATITASKERPSQPTTLTAAIVAAVKSDTDLGWLSEIHDSMWKLYRYNFDDPDPPSESWFPANKGNEAMMYLSYIIANYDSLPDYSIFIHGHRTSWHQEGDMVGLIDGIRIPALKKEGYIPLRCDWYPSCPSEIRPIDHDTTVWGPGVHREDAERQIGNAWLELFGPQVELPRTIASQCCAQFAVTRDAIRGRTKADYARMREWLLNTELINDISGRVFEKLWAYIMTKDAVRCPPPHQCACEYFGQCGPKDWPIPPDGLAKWPERNVTA